MVYVAIWYVHPVCQLNPELSKLGLLAAQHSPAGVVQLILSLAVPSRRGVSQCSHAGQEVGQEVHTGSSVTAAEAASGEHAALKQIAALASATVTPSKTRSQVRNLQTQHVVIARACMIV